MAAKKSEKKNDKKNDKPQVQSTEVKPVNVNLWDDDNWRRPEIVDPKLVLSTLEKLGLPIDDKASDRTNRLSSFYAHEAQQKKMNLVRCLPDDADSSLGCGFVSDEALNACPFCGMGGEVVAVPKEAPKADTDIELNVKAAEKKAEQKTESKPSDAAVKVTSKEVKNKKKARSETGNEAHAASPENVSNDIVPAQSETLANDLPSTAVGGSAKDLDRISNEIDAIKEEMLRGQALSMWRLGTLFAEIRDKKLWSTVRNDVDGSYAYTGLHMYLAQRHDFTPDHVTLMMRIATSMTEDQASIGIAKAKAILDAKLPDNMTNDLVTFASKKNAKGEFEHSVVELKLKIRELTKPQLPASSSGSVSTSANISSESTDSSNDADDEDEDDLDDDDEPDSTRTPTPTTKGPARQAQMTSVSFEKREFNIPLAIKGSQVKPAKKIQDEPHGTLALPGGSKIHVKIVIGDDGQLHVEGKIETPY